MVRFRQQNYLVWVRKKRGLSNTNAGLLGESLVFVRSIRLPSRPPWAHCTWSAPTEETPLKLSAITNNIKLRGGKSKMSWKEREWGQTLGRRERVRQSWNIVCHRTKWVGSQSQIASRWLTGGAARQVLLTAAARWIMADLCLFKHFTVHFQARACLLVLTKLSI